MAYADDIDALSPDHAFSFDGSVTDRTAALGSVNSGLVFSGSAICEGVSNSMVTNGINDVLTMSDSLTFTNVAQSRLALGGWLSLSAIQNPPKHAFLMGSATNAIKILVGWGNALMFELFSLGNFSIQVFGDVSLEVDRPYHLFMVFEGNGFSNEFRCYLDGVPQMDAEPPNRQPDSSELPGRSAMLFGIPPSGTSLVGGTQVSTLALINGGYNEWAFFDGANAVLTDAEVRVELFEKGALASVTISSDTEANMQIALDALSSTVRPNEALNIRVEAVTGGGDFTLTADDITHDPLASIHVQYMGIDTLTWVNNNDSDASIGSTPNGGVVAFVTPAVLTISPLIAGSEVRIYQAGTLNEIAGIENSGISFAQSINAASVDIIIHRPSYQYVKVGGVDMTSGDVSVPISQVFDRQYGNA